MASAETALQWLRDNLGMGEHPPGSNNNELTRWAGIGAVAWCAITVSRALDEAWGDSNRWQVPGVSADYSWGIAYVPSLRVRLMAAGVYGDEPRVGAVVIYAWGTGTPIGDHTGLVEAWVDSQGRARTDDFVADEWDGTVIALEGNAGDDLIRIRRSMAVIDGFGHPPYDDEEDDMFTDEDRAKLDGLYGVLRPDQGDQRSAGLVLGSLYYGLRGASGVDLETEEGRAAAAQYVQDRLANGMVDLEALADKVAARLQAGDGSADAKAVARAVVAELRAAKLTLG